MTKRKADVAARLARADEIALSVIERAAFEAWKEGVNITMKQAAMSSNAALLLAASVLLERGR